MFNCALERLGAVGQPHRQPLEEEAAPGSLDGCLHLRFLGDFYLVEGFYQIHLRKKSGILQLVTEVSDVREGEAVQLGGSVELAEVATRPVTPT